MGVYMKHRINRLPGVLFAFVMAAGLLPVQILAEDEVISSVSVTLDEPVAGASPDYTAQFPAEAHYYTSDYSDDIGYYRNNISWKIHIEGGTDSMNPDTEVFRYDNQYTVYIYLTPEEGYVFSSGTTATLNGQTAGARLNGPTLEVTYTFPVLEAPVSYPVWVSGIQVTSANKDDILGDGTVSFDPGSNTLTLNSATITGVHENANIYARGIELKVEGSAVISGGLYAVNSRAEVNKGGSVVLNGDFDMYGRANGIFADNNVTINGGTMTVRSDDESILAFGIFGTDVTINGGTVTASNPTGPGIKAMGRFSINGGIVDATGGTAAGAISANYGIIIADTHEITIPANGRISQNGQYITDGMRASHARIEPKKTFTVTYKVVNGTWSDDSTEDITESVTDGGSPAAIPADMKALPGYTGGAWDTDPAGATITGDTTFTYTFEATQPDPYPVWVGGIQVTDANKDDILGDGTASFDPDTGTLTLNGLTVGDGGHASGASIVSSGIDLTVTGSAVLSGAGYGILVLEDSDGGGKLTLDNASVTYAVTDGSEAGIEADGDITVSGGQIDISSAGPGIYSNNGSITIDSGTVTTASVDSGGIIADKAVTVSGGTVRTSGGTNGINAYSGAVTISGGTVEAEGEGTGIYSYSRGITITGGTVTVAGTGYEASGIYTTDLTISGGTLAVTARDIGIYVTGKLDVQNGTQKVSTEGRRAITASGGITIGDELSIVTPEGGKVSGDTVRDADSNVAETVVIMPDTVTYTVTFETNGGTEIEEQTVAEGETAEKPDDPVREGFVFDGWYSDEGLTEEYDFSEPVTEDITVYARWTEESVPAEITYTIVSGADSIWTKGSGKTVTITVKRSEEDETCFSHFTGFAIDGTLLSAEDYDAVAGSTVITVKTAALEKLSVGSHSVTISFDDGSVETTLTVKAAPAPSDGTGPKETGNGGQGNPTVPRTGDNSRTGLWMALMILSAAGLFGTVLIGRKYRFARRH